MPELPEVETIKRGLKKIVLNKKIIQVEIFEKKSFVGVDSEIVGVTVEGINRKGKALIFSLSNGRSLLVHLRMTGQLIWVGKERFAGGHPNESFIAELPNKQTRVVIRFAGGGELFFNDQRKFGFIKVLETKKVKDDEFIKKLGKEPWEITLDEFYEKLQRHKSSSIKATILDQTVIAGLGNIYADEALYFSGIKPTRKAGTISRREASKLIDGAKTVMERSLEAGGSTIRNYVKSDGTRGNYLELFAKVYGKEGERCERCGGKIEKIKVGGRGTHFCGNCQK